MREITFPPPSPRVFTLIPCLTGRMMLVSPPSHVPMGGLCGTWPDSLFGASVPSRYGKHRRCAFRRREADPLPP